MYKKPGNNGSTAILLILCLMLTLVKSLNYTLQLISQQNGAACLDGSAPGLYIYEGKNQNKDNFIVYFQGGGYCGDVDLSTTLESCYDRSNGNLGSSKYLSKTKDFDDSGILSSNSSLNQYFHEWTKIFVSYCDGAEYFGSRFQPVAYKDKKLFFRGSNNVFQTIRYLQKRFDIFNKNKIIVTGKSAGGIATYLYSDHFYNEAITSKVYSIPDSGLFLTDYYSPIAKQKVIRQLSQALIDIVWGLGRYPLTQCLQDFNYDMIQCLNAANLIKYRKVPMLILQTAYDQWPISNMIVTDCLKNKNPPFSLQNCNQTQMSAINEYRDQVRKSIIGMMKEKSNMGVWSPSCVQHGFINDHSFNDIHYKVPTNVGITVQDAIYQFIQNPQRPPVYIDTVNWPDNKGCSGKTQTNNIPNQQSF